MSENMVNKRSITSVLVKENVQIVLASVRVVYEEYKGLEVCILLCTTLNFQDSCLVLGNSRNFYVHKINCHWLYMTSVLIRENVQIYLMSVEWSIRDMYTYPPLCHIENPCLALVKTRNQCDLKIRAHGLLYPHRRYTKMYTSNQSC